MQQAADRPGRLIAAVLVSTFAIAFQLAAKATRDALFITSFGITLLPAMVVAAALTSMMVTLWLTRRLAARGPAALVPRLFVTSGLLIAGEWAFARVSLPFTAILVYLHVTTLGALLVSAFWALVNECFDPRAARRAISWITAGASFGGLLGGVVAERMGTAFSAVSMLPVLAFLHLAAAFLVRPLASSVPRSFEPLPEASAPTAVRVLKGSTYLRRLAYLIALAAAAEGVLDYVFKSRAAQVATGSAGLLRLFAVLYTATSLLTIAVQFTLLRPALARWGIARSAMLLPGGVGLGALGSLLLPGLPSIALARGLEIVLRNSFFRSATELLFAPVSLQERRATKPLIDVGAARVGDIAGAGVVQLALVTAPGRAGALLLGATVALAAGAFAVARRLQRGYLGALEQSLEAREEDLARTEDIAAAMFQTAGAIDLSLFRTQAEVKPAKPVPHAAPVPQSRELGLSSTDPEVARATLRSGPLAPGEVKQAIALLAWDAVAPDDIAALRVVVNQNLALLAERLLDPDEEFAVRRRVVAVLAASPTHEAVEALFAALSDRRFEVRYRVGLALVRLQEKMPEVGTNRVRVLDAVRREVAVERGVWEGRKLLDADDDLWSPLEADVVRSRANRSLEHVFTLLSLVLPAVPLRLAYRALMTDDAYLRGTGLEYLESVLPESIRVPLWPFLEEGGHRRRAQRPSGEVVEQLLASKESIVVALAAVRMRRDSPPSGTPAP